MAHRRHIVVSASQLHRMREFVKGEEKDKVNIRKEKMKDLKAKSEQRMSTWTNTIDALRQKSIDRKKKALQMQEDRLIALDKAEAVLHQRNRKKTIERARNIMFQNTDDALQLASATLLSDVLKEREYQAEVKCAMNTEKKRVDKQYLETMNRSMQQYDDNEEKKTNAQHRVRIDIARTLREQMRAAQCRRVRDDEDKRRVGQHLREVAIAAAEDEQQLKVKQELHAKQMMKEQIMANQNLQMLKNEAKREEQKYLLGIEAYAKKKQLTEELLKNKTEERGRIKMARRQRMIDKQAEDMKNRIETSDECIRKAVEEQDKRVERKEMDKKKRTAHMLEDIRSAMKFQLEQKKIIADKERQQEIKDLSRERDSATLYQENLVQNKKNARKRAQEIAAFHRLQISEKQDRIARELSLRDETTRHIADTRACADTKFREYAQAVKLEYAANEKSTRPIDIMMRSINERAMI